MNRINKLIRFVFFVLVRVIVLVLLGLNVRRKNLLPEKGPAIVVANHNSHLDTLVLISLFPLSKLAQIHPVAAADYFLRNKFLAWFSTCVIGITPILRGKASKSYSPLQPVPDALDRGEIVILFPEGTRGEPEEVSQFKKGVAHLAEQYPHVPIIPVLMHGLGKALPKGDFVLVPFFCDVFIGTPILFEADKTSFMTALSECFNALAAEGHYAVWEK